MEKGGESMRDEVKAMIKLKGKSLADLAVHLGMSRQALSNKFYRDSFSGEDLLKIASFLDCKLAFIDESNKIFLG